MHTPAHSIPPEGQPHNPSVHWPPSAQTTPALGTAQSPEAPQNRTDVAGSTQNTCPVTVSAQASSPVGHPSEQVPLMQSLPTQVAPRCWPAQSSDAPQNPVSVRGSTQLPSHRTRPLAQSVPPLLDPPATLLEPDTPLAADEPTPLPDVTSPDDPPADDAPLAPPLPLAWRDVDPDWTTLPDEPPAPATQTPPTQRWPPPQSKLALH